MQDSQFGQVLHNFSLSHLSLLWNILTGINLMYMWNKHSTECFTYLMIKGGSTWTKEGKITLDNHEERLHWRKEKKNTEIISKGKEEKR